MRKLLPIYLITWVTLLSTASLPPVSATSGTRTVAVIQGYVYDSATNIGLEDVLVSAADISVSTDTVGFYTLVIEPGNYDIYYTKEGWSTHIIIGLAVADTMNIDVVLQCHYVDFPFFEDWSSGDFETNGWTFEPEQGNWGINTEAGNPDPCAQFSWNPTQLNYSFELHSMEIDTRSVISDVWLRFDYRLNIFSSTGNEKLRVDIWDGTDWIELIEFANTQHIMWTHHAVNITQYASGKFTKVRFVAHGQNSFNLENWRIDNIRFDLAPNIALSQDYFWAILNPPGGLINWAFDIFNNGAGTLNYNIIVEFPDAVIQGEETISQELDLSLDPVQRPGGEPATTAQENEVILNYDGPNNDAIGLTAGGTFSVAARFPSSMVGQYAGYILKTVDIYINDLPSNLILKVWGAGTTNSPGELLHQQPFNPQAESWNTLDLNNNVILDGTDIWVGYDINHGSGLFPAGVDGGPANPDGDWISTDGVVWEHLAGYGLNYNWNIRAMIESNEPPWLIVEPNYGSIPAGDYERVWIIANPMLLDIGGHEAHIKIYSNDPQNPVVLVIVHLSIGTFLEDIYSDDFLSCYPIPASDKLYLEINLAVTDFRIINHMGQAVLSRKAEGEETFVVDVRHLPNGMYFLQADAKDGRVYSRKIVISR